MDRAYDVLSGRFSSYMKLAAASRTPFRDSQAYLPPDGRRRCLEEPLA